MGKVWSMVKRPIIMFNIENRAHRVIAKEKPKPAPKHKADDESLRKILKDNPEIVEVCSRRDTHLYDRLKSVYLTSKDPEKITETRKILPLSKERVEEFELGIKEPENVAPGHMSLRTTLKFFADCHMKKLPVKDLAVKYSIDEEIIKNLAKYYGTFDIYVPDDTTESLKRIAKQTFEYEKLNAGQ